MRGVTGFRSRGRGLLSKLKRCSTAFGRHAVSRPTLDGGPNPPQMRYDKNRAFKERANDSVDVQRGHQDL